jgi:L-serine dehydratase
MRWRNLIKIIKGLNMKSLKELYRIGLGPSSSHTIGPYNAALIFKEKNF